MDHVLQFHLCIFGRAGSPLLSAGFFSSGGEQGLISGGWASHCGGLSCCRAQTVGAQASVAATPGLQQLPLLGSGGQAQ